MLDPHLAATRARLSSPHAQGGCLVGVGPLCREQRLDFRVLRLSVMGRESGASWCAEGLNTSWEADWRAVGNNGSGTWDGGSEMRAQAGPRPPASALAWKTWRSRLTRRGDDGRPCRPDPGFLHCVRTGETPETVSTDNIKSLAMVFGAIESAGSGRCVGYDGSSGRAALVARPPVSLQDSLNKASTAGMG
jgi:hypothetical protein